MFAQNLNKVSNCFKLLICFENIKFKIILKISTILDILREHSMNKGKIINSLLDVSAIIPTYNSEKFIKKTLDSLLMQTFKFYEILIIDDNSMDNTCSIVDELVEEYKGYIKLKKLMKNFGPSYVRNLGLSMVKSDWVLFMDHDDIAMPNLLELECKKLKFLEQQTRDKWILVHSAYRQITENDEYIPGIHCSHQFKNNEILGYQFIRNNIITTSGVLLNKACTLEVGGFNNDLKYSQDWDLWIKLAQKGGFAYVDEPLINVRRHMNNTSNNVTNFLKDEVSILKQYELSFIQSAVYNRNLPLEKNMMDYVTILYRLGYWNEGFEIINEVKNKKPNSASAFFLLGLYYLNKNLWNIAQECFMETVIINPNHGAALNNLGIILSIEGRRNEGIKYFQKACYLFPNYNDARHNLGIAKAGGRLNTDIFRVTWRELRPVLLSYCE